MTEDTQNNQNNAEEQAVVVTANDPVVDVAPQTPAEVTSINSVPELPAETPVPSPPPQATAAVPATELDNKFSINIGKWKEHLALALTKRKERWQKTLDKVLALAQSQDAITNQQTKKLLRCTKLTAWRYLKTLEKQGKIKRTGNHNTPTYKILK